MAFHTQGLKPPSGLDDGRPPTKPRKRKRDSAAVDSASIPQAKVDAPEPDERLRIRPGEKMSDFAARVDAALPVGGSLVAKRGVEEARGKGVTRLERKMVRMRKGWWEEEERRRERREEEKEGEEEGLGMEMGEVGRKKGRGKTGKGAGDGDEEDIWKSVGQSRGVWEVSNAKGLVGLHDVVQAPPQLSRKPKELFRVRNEARVDVVDVPGRAGSLRKREELGQARRGVIEGYRRLMDERSRGKAA